MYERADRLPELSGELRWIAEAIAQGLTESGCEVKLAPVDEQPVADFSLDFLLVGAATRWPGARPKIRKYAKQAAGVLAGKPFAAFSTGGMVFNEKPNTQAASQIYEVLEGGRAGPARAGVEGEDVGGRRPPRGPRVPSRRARSCALWSSVAR